MLLGPGVFPSVERTIRISAVAFPLWNYNWNQRGSQEAKTNMLPDITAQQEVESSFKAAELTIDITDKRASEALKYKDMINEQWMKSREATQVFFLWSDLRSD